MRKFLSTVLVLILLASTSTTAFAADFEDESAGNGESEIYAHLYSSYQIFIPTTIDLRNGEQGAVTISDANIEAGYSVKVYCTNITDNGIRLYNVSNSSHSIICGIMDIYNNRSISESSMPLVTFSASEIDGESLTKYFGLEIIDTWGAAGDYVGTMQYSFSCTQDD